MNDRSNSSDPQTLDLFDEPISSPEPGFGRSPADFPGGRPIISSGPRLAPASRSRQPARGSEPMTQGTCGRTYFASSVPSGPLASWENRLRERLATLGSTESALIWKASVTPAGRSKSRLVQSTVHKNGPETGGSQWPTATVNPDNKSPEAHLAMKQRMGERDGTFSDRTAITDLQVMLKAQWPAPTVADVEGGRKTRSGARSDELLLNGLMAAQWPAPMAEDGHHGHRGISEARIAKRLAAGRQLSSQEFMVAAIGPTPTGSLAQTERRGAPNPIFACWLMGWPDELTYGALQAIQSFRGSRRKSSRRS
jgi:hypothetical protein